MSDLWTQIIFALSSNGDEIKKKRKIIYKTRGKFILYEGVRFKFIKAIDLQFLILRQ
jgi:hypothetical protein